MRRGVGAVRPRARAVVIGGGVGGCAVAYWLTRLGWDDIVLVERAELTSGSTFHSAGLVGQLRSSLSLTKMMMSSVELYRSLEGEVGLETGGARSARCGSRPRRSGWRRSPARPAGRRPSAFRSSSSRQPRHRSCSRRCRPRRARRGVPAHGRVHRPEPAHVRARGGARAGAGRRSSSERASRDPCSTRPRRGGRDRPRRDRDRGRRQRRRHVRARARSAGRRQRADRADGARVPGHAPGGLPLEMPTMRDPSLLVYFRPESGGTVMGGYERNCAPWSLDGIPADFNSKLLEEDWPRFEELIENAVVRVPGLAEMEVVRLINGPEAFTPRRRVHPRSVRGAGLLAGDRLLRARPGGRGRDGPPRRRVDRRGHAVARRLAHGLAAVRTRVPQPRLHARPHPRGLRDVLRRQVPGPRADGRQAARLSPAYPRLRRSGPRSARSPAGSGPTGSTQRRSRRRVAAAARLGRTAVVARDRRRAPAPAGSAAAFDETSFAKLDVTGDGAADFLERLCDNRVARDVGRITYTQMLNPRGGVECDFTVSRLADDRFRIVTGTAFGQHDLAWLLQHAPGRRLVPSRGRDVGHACYGLGGRGARAPAAAREQRPRQRGVPVHDRTGARRSAACRASRYG